MLAYGAHVPAAVQARINYVVDAFNEAVETARANSLTSTSFTGGPFGQGGVIFHSQSTVVDAAMFDGVLGVLDEAIVALCRAAVQAHWSGYALLTTVDDIKGQILIRAYARHHSKAITLDAFLHRVEDALQARPTWAQLLTVAQSAVPAEAARQPGPSPSDDPHPPLTVLDAAVRLNLSVSTVRRMVNNGAIKAAKIGGRIRIPAAEIDRLLDTPKFQFPDR